MLRNVVDEIVRRRLWPIAVVAVLVLVAAPLLFLRPAPHDAAPAAAAEPARVPAPAGDDLPARAQRLLASSDAVGKRGRGLSRTARDPFEPPAGHRAATAAKAAPARAPEKPAAGSSSGGSKRPAPIPVVVTNASGRSPAPPASRATAPARRRETRERQAPRARPSHAPSVPTVDVRFGARKDSRIRRRIARLTAFRAGGKVVAVFVKYSPRRNKAVFAIAPTTTVRGDVKCRRKDGLCRYVDIPAGSYVRLTALAADGSLVSRRLDVVRVHDEG